MNRTLHEGRVAPESEPVRQVRAAALIGYVDVARAVGLDPFEMLRAAKINPHFLDDVENRHAAGPVFALLEESAARSHCDSFGLKMADHRSFADIGPLALLLEHLPTLDDVVLALRQYRRLINDITTLECQRGEESAVLRWSTVPEYKEPQATVLAVALGYRVLKEITGGRWQADAVHFTHASPQCLSDFRRFFDAPVEFGSSFDGYSCTTASLRTPTLAPGEKMADNARRLLSLVPLDKEDAPIAHRVQRAIALFLPVGNASLATVASSLGLNSRTLQRRLDFESTTFKALLNRTRRSLARQYLADPTHPIGIVAELTGYSTTGSFTRWFVSQFGKTPSEWRADAARPTSIALDIVREEKPMPMDSAFVRSFALSPANF